jgi:hypothetical protein
LQAAVVAVEERLLRLAQELLVAVAVVEMLMLLLVEAQQTVA